MDGFLMENPIKMDDLGVPLFSETSKGIFVLPWVGGPWKSHKELPGPGFVSKAWSISVWLEMLVFWTSTLQVVSISINQSSRWEHFWSDNIQKLQYRCLWVAICRPLWDIFLHGWDWDEWLPPLKRCWTQRPQMHLVKLVCPSYIHQSSWSKWEDVMSHR